MIDFINKVPFTYGTEKMDKIFGKYDIGLLNIIVGESGHGKTAYSFWQFEQNMKHNNCVYLNLEMSNKQLFIIKSRARAGISKEQWNDKTMSDIQKDIAKSEYKRLSNIRGIIDGNYDLEGLIAIIHDYVEQGYKLFYIDNLGFIGKTNIKTSEWEHTAEISRLLKQACNKWGITINLIHHFNKGSDKDRSKARGLGSIRGSGKIENDADSVVLVYRDYEQGETIISLLKDREWGSNVTYALQFNKGSFIDPGTTAEEENIKETEELF